MIFQNIPAIQVALPVNSTGIDKRASPVDIDLPLYFKHSAIFKVAIYTHIRIYLQRTTYFQGASVKIQIIGGIGLPGQNTVDPVVSIQIQITATAQVFITLPTSQFKYCLMIILSEDVNRGMNNIHTAAHHRLIRHFRSTAIVIDPLLSHVRLEVTGGQKKHNSKNR